LYLPNHPESKIKGIFGFLRDLGALGGPKKPFSLYPDLLSPSYDEL
jgi:hypothetical protein